MFDLDKYKVKTANPCNTIAVHITYEPFGWAQFVLDTSINVLSIESDWGSWAYRWNGEGFPRGKTFKESVLLWGPDYISHKLVGSDVQVFSIKKTKNALKQVVIACRKQLRVDKEEARYFYDGVEDADWGGSRDIYYSTLANEMEEKLGLRYLPDYFEDELSQSYLVLSKILIPSFLEYLKPCEHLRLGNDGGNRPESTVCLDCGDQW